MSGVLASYPANEAPEERHARVLAALSARFGVATFEGDAVRVAALEAAECVAALVAERDDALRELEIAAGECSCGAWSATPTWRGCGRSGRRREE